MPAPKVVRPRPEFFESQRYMDLTSYLADHWERAEAARRQQVDEKYTAWQKSYDGVPAQLMRTLPWPGASNFVVQLSRMFVDTFVARTLNIVFATRPLYTLNFLPTETKDSVEKYINDKALGVWDHYELTRSMLMRGAKNGTVVVKTPYIIEEEIDVKDENMEEVVTTYSGPRSTPVPFEDFYLYPITVNRLQDAHIKFHKVRFIEEDALARAEKWNVEEEEIRKALKDPQDVKRQDEQQQAGVVDPLLRELHLVECHLKFAMESGKQYQIIALLEPISKKLFDVYYNPYPRNVDIFQDYRPAPKEDFFFGDSWCHILMQSQEEASTIHNDRRNNSYIANAPIFKRRRGSLLPNPSTSWYPGKVWDLDDMSDFEIVMIGRNYNDMLQEESHTFMLAEKLVGLGALQQGNASGMMGKRGIYNAAGTLAVLSESNQRQDTNIRDIRSVLAAVGKVSFMLQREYGSDDPIIEMYPQKVAQQIREGLSASEASLLAKSYFQIKPSDAGANSEVAKANTLQVAQIVGQYGAMVPQIAQQLATMPPSPVRSLMLELAKLHKTMATKMLRTFGDYDGEEYLPDVERAFNGGVQAGTAQGSSEGAPSGFLPGGAGASAGGSVPQALASIAEVPLPPA